MIGYFGIMLEDFFVIQEWKGYCRMLSTSNQNSFTKCNLTAIIVLRALNYLNKCWMLSQNILGHFMNFQYTYQIPIWLLLQGFCLLLTIFSAVWLMNVIVLMETRPVIGRREHKGAVSIVFRVLFLVLLLQGLGSLAFSSSIASFHVSIHLAS